MNEKKPPPLFSFIRRRSALSLDRLVPDEFDLADPDLRPLVDVERHVHQLRTALDLLDLRLHLGELMPFRRVDLADGARDAPQQAGIDERVEPNLELLLFQLVVDLRLVDLVGADVVDDLDPLPLLHVVDHDLPDHAIGEAHVAHLGNQIVEEVRTPQPLEVGRR